MRRGGGRQKGHGFENKFANVLTKWSGLKHRRVPQSGGWHKQVVSGDVFCVAEYEFDPERERIFVPLSWECKCAESWDFVHFFKDSDKPSLRQWWQQASDDAEQSHKLPALIFTKNYFPTFVMLHSRTFNRLAKLVGSSWRKFTHTTCQLSKNDQVVVLLLDDFLGWLSFETLLKLTV